MRTVKVDGRSFTKAKGDIYWKNTGLGYLHRYIWKKHNGSIPKGHYIHHKDGNVDNNDIKNLECVTPKQHWRRHPRIVTPSTQALKAAKKWHKSKAGSEWHSKHAKNQWKNKKPKTKPCKFCGNKFEYYTKAYFCSNKCKMSQYRREGRIPKKIKK